MYLFTTLRQLWALVPEGDHRRLWGIGVSVAASALLETLTVLAIVPFMLAVSSPESMYDTDLLGIVHGWMGRPERNVFLMGLGSGMLGLVVLSNATAAFVMWRLQRFAWDQYHGLSYRLLLRYLGQPYPFFLGRNSAELSKNILSDVEVVVTGILLPVVFSAARAILALFLLAMLFLVDPEVALVSITVLGGAYAAIYRFVRHPIGRAGEIRLEANSERYRRAAEALAGVKAVKILGKEEAFLDRFEDPSRRFASATSIREMYTVLPRYALEAVAFGGIILLILLVLIRPGGPEGALPTVALYGFAGLKLLPALQQVFSGFATIRFSVPTLERMHAELTELPAPEGAATDWDLTPVVGKPLVELRDVSFRYPESEAEAVDGVSMTLLAGGMHGIVGSTGSGKTTVADIVLGLLAPGSGQVVVSGRPLTELGAESWRLKVGYVPQEIFLSDDTLRANIAFGVDSASVDEDRLARAVDVAMLRDVIRELPKGLDTSVGERGTRLSGGQRQRIGIARALYTSPAVLVMDEATSALDPATERKVVSSLRALGVTCLWVTHRLATVESFDLIFVMDQARLVGQGTHLDLREGCEAYQELLGSVDG